MSLSKEHLITLLKTPKIGPVTVKAVNENANFKISGVNDLRDLLIDTKQQNSKIHIPTIEELIAAHEQAQSILERCEINGIQAISLNESDYPIKLFRLSDYPIVIYIKGNIAAAQCKQTVAVIGTREPSGFGQKVGRRVSGILAKNGFSIISGLAIGCDTAGHLGALDAHASTVAVLASGVDIIYPKENQELAQRIVDSGGALLSEYEPGLRPQKSSFVERDRLQTGLSDGIVVVETDVQGGTMHAVRCAQKLNISIGCLTGHPEHLKDFPKIQGNKYLLNLGASPLGNADQIFSFIKRMNPDAIELKDYTAPKEPLQVNVVTETPSTPEVIGAEPPTSKYETIDKPIEHQTYDNLLNRVINLERQVSKLLELQSESIKLLHTFMSAQDSKENAAVSKSRSKKKSDIQPKLL